MKLKEGDILNIQGKTYEVVKTLQEVDWYDSKKDEIQGKHLEVSLHEVGNNTIHPTHILKIYVDNTAEAFLYRLTYDDTSKGIEQPRTRGGIISLRDEQIIPLNAIKRF